jgi:hypothetical protein
VKVLQLIGPLSRKKPDRFKLVSPIFESLLETKNLAVKSETLRQLANLGPIALPTEKLLRDAAKERQPEIALLAIEALIRLRPDKGNSLVPQLIELAEKRDRAALGARDLLELMEKLKLLQQPGNEEDWGASMGEQIEQRKRRESGAWHREELLRLHSIIELGDLKGKTCRRCHRGSPRGGMSPPAVRPSRPRCDYSSMGRNISAVAAICRLSISKFLLPRAVSEAGVVGLVFHFKDLVPGFTAVRFLQ